MDDRIASFKRIMSMTMALAYVADLLGVEAPNPSGSLEEQNQVFVDSVKKRAEELRAELEACRKDAEMFRRLRDAAIRDHGYTADHFEAEFSRALDAIDAAMKEGGV